MIHLDTSYFEVFMHIGITIMGLLMVGPMVFNVLPKTPSGAKMRCTRCANYFTTKPYIEVVKGGWNECTNLRCPDCTTFYEAREEEARIDQLPRRREAIAATRALREGN
jgi:hypothetical protein